MIRIIEILDQQYPELQEFAANRNVCVHNEALWSEGKVQECEECTRELLKNDCGHGYDRVRL